MARVLLCEDDQFLREVYSESLSAEFEFDSASDGQEALDKIKTGGWDLVLLDVIMPKMSGVDVIKTLGDERFQFAKKIIFLSNLDEETSRQQLQGMGDGYMMKSELTPSQLIEKVHAYLPVQTVASN